MEEKSGEFIRRLRRFSQMLRIVFEPGLVGLVGLPGLGNADMAGALNHGNHKIPLIQVQTKSASICDICG
jgi:hypothetical protein